MTLVNEFQPLCCMVHLAPLAQSSLTGRGVSYIRIGHFQRDGTPDTYSAAFRYVVKEHAASYLLSFNTLSLTLDWDTA